MVGARHSFFGRGGFAALGGARALHLLACLLVTVAALFAATEAVSAHASLLRSTPVEGEVIRDAPVQVVLTFSEPVTPLVAKLLRPDGRPASLVAGVSGADVRIALPANEVASQGTYLLSWRVVSADGHPVAGNLTFSSGTPSAAAPVAPELTDRALQIVLWGAKLALYLGLFLGAGGAFALAWLTPGSRSGVGIVGALVGLGLAAAPLSFALQGLDALGAPLGLFGQAMVWQTAAATSYALTAATAFIALALALLALAAEKSMARWLSLGALAGVGAALAASGHASAAAPQWLTRPMVFVHGVGIAFWAGALLPLGFAYRRKAADAGPALRRLSVTVPYVVAALIVAGLVLAFVQVGTVSALWQTAYGRLLLLKLALIVPLLLLAAANRWRLTKPALAGQSDARRRLVRNIGLETLLMVAILAVVAGFRFTPPPRVLAVEAAEPIALHIHTAQAMAELSITPGHAGVVAASIVVMSGDFGPLDARAVTLRLANPQADATPISAGAHKPGDGTWRVDALDLPVGGKWTVAIDIEISASERTTLTGEVVLRP
ncbi:copper resistance CopC/CopD family protein [Mesorhizobium sp. ANAO-SY3R2]|uniref:copper resistance CopC/CopD family protein n=1 Tax=Mesorhizobium sp. ANAO-SY3R2 TaxID=3166644 RepID=UPI00366E6B7C